MWHALWKNSDSSDQILLITIMGNNFILWYKILITTIFLVCMVLLLLCYFLRRKVSFNNPLYIFYLGWKWMHLKDMNFVPVAVDTLNQNMNYIINMLQQLTI